MNASTKSLLMLVSMLVLGAVLGAGGMAVLRPVPNGPPPPPPGGASGFVAHMRETIQPRDDAQRAAILPILEATDRRNRATVDATQQRMRDNLDSMRVELAPLLDATQLERLDDLVRSLSRPGPEGGPGRGGPPPGRGGPPPGRGGR